MRLRLLALALGLTAVSGCSFGGDDAGNAAKPAPPRELTGAQAQAPAAPTSAALTRIPDGPQAQRRLAYVGLEQVGEAELPFSRRKLLDAVLGRGAAVASGLPAGAAVSAIQVGAAATVLRGPGLGDVAGVPSGDDGKVVGVTGAAAAALADSHPDTSAITPTAQSAVQSCLGDTLAQTILGPATMGFDAALGVGLAEGDDEPVGLQLRVCGAPRFVRHLHAMEKTLARRFPAATVAEQEIGEREIVSAVLAADALDGRRALDLLAGGQALRALAWR